MKINTTQDAVIYCRSAVVSQRDAEHLAGQEARCREYAADKGYNVVKVFRDEGVSGTQSNHPGIEGMLSFLNDHSGPGQPIVIIDNISRLARSLSVHLELRSAIDEAGGRLESPSVDFGKAPASRLTEYILAGEAQYERLAEQTNQQGKHNR